jgi:hypothetical protein
LADATELSPFCIIANADLPSKNDAIADLSAIRKSAPEANAQASPTFTP